MKYIIDIPDGMTCINALKYEDSKCVAARSYIIPDLTPYTEPDRKAVDLQYAHDIENVARMNYNEGAKDAWEFARAINYLEYDDFVSCFGGKTEEAVYELSYSEVKAEYEAWKKQKDEIRVGDEVIYNSRTRAVVLEPETEKKYGEIFTSEGSTIVVSHDDLEKTGRHFDEVEELLKKMKEQ